MKKLVLLFLIIPSFIYSQGWEKIYNEGASTCSINQTVDSGFVILAANSPDYILIKTDKFGSVIWLKRINGASSIGRKCMVQQAPDGGYIIGGNSEVDDLQGPVISIIKTDSLGNVIWNYKYESGVFGEFVNTNDNGYLIVGSAGSLNYQDDDFYLLKINENGDQLWTKRYGKIGDDEAYSVQQTLDNGYIITGKTADGPDYNIYVVKTNVNGDSLWTKIYESYGRQIAMSVKETINGGYIICGSSNTFNSGISEEVYLMNIDDRGDIIWTKKYGDEYQDYGKVVDQTADGGFFITGVTQTYKDYHNFDYQLIKTNSLGDTLWTSTFGGEDDDYCFSGLPTFDGGYIVAGHSFFYGGASIYVVKTNNMGQSSTTSIIELPQAIGSRKLIKTIDLQGREIQPKDNIPYIEVYDDGSTEKKVIVK